MEFRYNDNLSTLTYPVGYHLDGHNLGVIYYMAQLIDEICPTGQRNINIFCRGSSGAILSGIIAPKLIEKRYNVMICHIKKQHELSHCNSIRPIIGGFNIVLDDIISTGETVEEIVNSSKTTIDAIIVSGCVSVKDYLEHIFFNKVKTIYCLC